jgi:tetratricopeptide (TPR) repeat protein
VSVPIEGLPRRVIPRWRDFRTAASLGELSSPGVVAGLSDIPSATGRLSGQWKVNQSEELAGELLSASWLEGAQDLAVEAARYLLRKGSVAQELTKSFARSVIQEAAGASLTPSETSAPLNQSAVSAIRSALRLYPHDALGWCELSRYYAIIGKQEKARRAMRTAVGLAPESRYILRSASRCFVHLGDLDSALEVLDRPARVSDDPWLHAAHVSVANILDKPPRFYKRAKELSKSASLPPVHTAELNAALGTLELCSGNDKAARRMLMASLSDPTENVIAQALWARSKISIPIELDLLKRPRSFEANTRALFFAEHWEEAERAAEKWRDDEPFSSNPAIQLSFILSVAFEEHTRAVEFLDLAYRANPDDLLVINNLAFALAHLGKPKEAHNLLAGIRAENLPPSRLVSLTATAGLIRFREGDVQEGRGLYDEAIRLARKHNLDRQAAWAAVFLAKEEQRAGTARTEEALAEAQAIGSVHGDPISRLLMKTLRDGPLQRKGNLNAPDSRLV